MNDSFRGLALALLLALMPAWALAEDGYELWLRYRPLGGAAQARLQAHAGGVVRLAPDSPTLRAAVDELRRGIGGLAGQEPARLSRPRAGVLVLVTRALAPAGLELPWEQLGA